MAQLSWLLADLDGRIIDEFQSVQAGVATIGLNDRRTAKCVVSLEDPLAAEVFPLARVLKVFYDHVPLVCARVTLPRFRGRDGTVEINTIDPRGHLERLYLNQRTDGARIQDAITAGLDQGEIAYRYMEHVSPTKAETAAGVPGHGIVRGSVEKTQPRTLDLTDYDGKQAAKAIDELTQLRGGIDVELVPVDRTDQVLCQMNVYSRQGRDLTDSVIFEFNTGQSNCADFVYEPDGMQTINRATTVGQSVEGEPPVSYMARQPESELAFGIWGDYQGKPDTTDLATLRDLAMEKVSALAWPPDYFTVTPTLEGGRGFYRDGQSGAIVQAGGSFGQSPRFGPDPTQHDYWIGDSFTALGRVRPGLDKRVTGRVTDARVTQFDDAGNVLVEIGAAPGLVGAGVV